MNRLIRFILNGHNVASVNGMIAPRAGIRRIPHELTLEAKVTPAAGQIMMSDGSLPGSDGVNSAVIVELGRSAPVHNGSAMVIAKVLVCSYDDHRS